MFNLILLQSPELHLILYASDLCGFLPLNVTGVSAPSVIKSAAASPSAPTSDSSALLRPLSQVLEHPSLHPSFSQLSILFFFLFPTLQVFVEPASDLRFNIQYRQDPSGNWKSIYLSGYIYKYDAKDVVKFKTIILLFKIVGLGKGVK